MVNNNTFDFLLYIHLHRYIIIMDFFFVCLFFFFFCFAVLCTYVYCALTMSSLYRKIILKAVVLFAQKFPQAWEILSIKKAAFILSMRTYIHLICIYTYKNL